VAKDNKKQKLNYSQAIDSVYVFIIPSLNKISY